MKATSFLVYIVLYIGAGRILYCKANEKELTIGDVVGVRLTMDYGLGPDLYTYKTVNIIYGIVKQDGRSPFPGYDSIHRYTYEDDEYNKYLNLAKKGPEIKEEDLIINDLVGAKIPIPFKIGSDVSTRLSNDIKHDTVKEDKRNPFPSMQILEHYRRIKE